MMAEGHRKDEWQRASMIAMVIANSNPYRKGKAFSASDFDPFAKKGNEPGVSRVSITDFSMMFPPAKQ